MSAPSPNVGKSLPQTNMHLHWERKYYQSRLLILYQSRTSTLLSLHANEAWGLPSILKQNKVHWWKWKCRPHPKSFKLTLHSDSISGWSPSILMFFFLRVVSLFYLHRKEKNTWMWHPKTLTFDSCFTLGFFYFVKASGGTLVHPEWCDVSFPKLYLSYCVDREFDVRGWPAEMLCRDLTGRFDWATSEKKGHDPEGINFVCTYM